MPQFARKQSQDYQDKIIKEIEAEPDRHLKMFSDFEDEIIKKYYPTKGAAAIAPRIGKTKKQVINRATALGIRRV